MTLSQEDRLSHVDHDPAQLRRPYPIHVLMTLSHKVRPSAHFSGLFFPMRLDSAHISHTLFTAVRLGIHFSWQYFIKSDSVYISHDTVP
jgi:hypothetical protein